MRAAWWMLGALAVLAIAYRYYSAFLAAKVLVLDDARTTPAHTKNDGQNFHPTRKLVLFGHHFAAISGAGPLIGPVLAAQYGFYPGFFWILIGVVLALFLVRYALIRAEPSPSGLRVVNIVRSHDLEWAQVVRVGFSGGAPWAVLELTDTEEVAVMAIQRADGQRAQREAARLAALIEHHSRPQGATLD